MGGLNKNEKACLQGILEIGLFQEDVKKTTIKIKGLRVRLLRGVVEDVCACECENRMPFLKMQVFIQEIYDLVIVKSLNQWF